MNELLKRLRTLFTIREVRQQRDDLVFFHVAKKHGEAAIRHLRDHEDYNHLVLLTAVDHIEDGLFRLTYLLHNYRNHSTVGVQVDLKRNDPVMTSIHGLWEQAGLYQRELKEMFGIDFPGSPRIDEDFLLEGWEEIPPMRREFDTRAYAEKTFFPREGRETNDPRSHMQKQLYPDGGDR